MGVGINARADLLFNTFDDLNIPVFVVDEDRTVVGSNLTACSVFQYTPGDMIGREIGQIVSLDDDAKGEAGGPQVSVRLESTCTRKNGETFVARVSLIPQNDGRRLVVVQDISDQKRLRQRATQRTKELSIFNTFAAVLTGLKETEKIMQETVDMLISMMEADAGWIYLADDETGELHLKARSGLDEGFVADIKRLRPGECFNGKVFASGRPLLVKKAFDDPRVQHQGSRLNSMAGVPISSRGDNLGVLGIGSRKVGYFSAMDIQLLSTIGSQLGVAIENTKLIGQLREKMKQIELISE